VKVVDVANRDNELLFCFCFYSFILGSNYDEWFYLEAGLVVVIVELLLHSLFALCTYYLRSEIKYTHAKLVRSKIKYTYCVKKVPVSIEDHIDYSTVHTGKIS
jgi:hypothetical protein